MHFWERESCGGGGGEAERSIWKALRNKYVAEGGRRRGRGEDGEIERRERDSADTERERKRTRRAESKKVEQSRTKSA